MHMQKSFKILGIIVLSVVALAAVGLVWAHRLSLEPTIDYELQLRFRDVGILCEWHYPSLEGEPTHIEVCYTTRLGVQCYRIEGNHVVNYHRFYAAKQFSPSGIQARMFSEQGARLAEMIHGVMESSWPPRWHWNSPFVGRFVHDVTKVAYDSDDNEDTIFSCIISNMTAQIRQFETNNVGYVSMTTWWDPWSWGGTAYPLDEAPPAFTVLRSVFEQCMADPATREYHTTYIRGYPIPPPENSDYIPVFEAGLRGSRQRDIVQFLPSLGGVLIPIQKGINPFRKFNASYVPGNSLIINYRNEGNDRVLYLHGDNFVRVQVYGGEKPTE